MRYISLRDAEPGIQSTISPELRNEGLKCIRSGIEALGAVTMDENSTYHMV